MQGIGIKGYGQEKPTMPEFGNQYFIENKGQWDNEVLFLTKQNGMNAWITKHGITYDFYKITDRRQEDDKRLDFRKKNQQVDKFIEGHVVKISLVQPSPQLKTEGAKKLKAYQNYFIGNDKTKWQSNVGLFEEAVIKNNMQQIDTRYYFDKQQLRYDYLVQPNANPNDIQFSIEGSSKNYINPKGELVFTTQFGEVKQSELFTYQIIDGIKIKIASQFKSIEGGKFGFQVGNYDKRFPLIIDPILYATYYGGVNQEECRMKAINSHEVVIAGTTNSSTFFVVGGPYSFKANTDIFIAKFDPTIGGTPGLVYSTYLGSYEYDFCSALDIGANGEIYVTGNTDSPSGYPLVSGITNILQGNEDFVLSKFNSSGSSLTYSTLLGGNGVGINTNEAATGLFVKNDIAYVSGMTNSSNLPCTPNAIGCTLLGVQDFAIYKINTLVSGLSGIEYCSHLGGSDYESYIYISVDNQDRIYLTGTTTSIDFPTTLNGFDQTYNGQLDATFSLLEVNQLSTNLLYSTFLGGSQDDRFNSLIVDNNKAILVGITNSNDFPVTANAYDNTFNGSFDGIVTQIDPSNSGLLSNVYSTFIGASDYDDFVNVKIDPCNNNWVICGTTLSSTFPLQNPQYSSYGGGAGDANLLKINPTLVPSGLVYSTYLPGGVNDFGRSVDFDNQGNLYVAGYTNSSNFAPVAASPIAPFQPNNSGNGDAFLMKIETCLPFLAASYTPTFVGCDLHLFATGGLTYNWTGPNGFTSNAQNPIINNTTALNAGIYTVTSTNANCCTDQTTINVTFDIATITSWNGTQCLGDELIAHPPTTIGSSSFTYSWQGPGPILNPTAQVLQPTTAGIFTVTVSDANGCTATSTFSISNGPINLVAASNTNGTACAGIPVSLFATSNSIYPPVTYAWANNTTPTTGNTVSATPLASTIYTVVATDNLGCSASTQISIEVTYCCSPQAQNIASDPQTILLNNKTSSYLIGLLGTSSIQNRTLFVNGTFTIDQNVILGTNVHVYFTPNSNIVIQPNKLLEMNGAGLTSPLGCDMWGGIFASSPTSELRIQNSTLRDMIYGLAISNNAFLSVTGSTFSDNRQSILLSNCNVPSSCIIKGNLFNRITNLHAPYVAEVKPRWGIRTSICNNLVIGDQNDPNNGNTFDGLWCGIFAENGNGVLSINSTINLYNNKFRNISAGIWGNQITSSTRGWGVYAWNNNLAVNFRVNVYGANTSTTDHFFQCDKGILLRNTGGIVSNNEFENTALGVLMTECAGRTFSINNNVLNNSEIGICKIGDESVAGFTAQLNTINLIDDNTQIISGVDVPTGIMSTYSSFNNIGRTKILSNTINMPSIDEGIGISLSQGSSDYIQGNIIHMTGASGNTAFNIPRLIGIFSSVNINCSILSNLVDNNNSVNGNTTFVPGNNAGIFTIYNLNSIIKCNTLSYLQTGFLAVGPNGSQSNYNQTNGNVMLASAADFLFWELALDGTFGQVGKVISTNPLITYDANNTFLGTTTLNRVCRVTNCATNFNDEIVTTAAKLTQTQSIATNLPPNSCELNVTNLTNFTQTYMCSSSGTPSEEETLNLDYQYALLVASDNLVYDEFEAGTKHLNEAMLLDWLRDNQTALTERPILNSFYLEKVADLVGQLDEIDFEIAGLADSVLMADSLAKAQKLNLIDTLNNQISSTEIFAINAKLVNAYYIKVMRVGIEILNSIAQEEIKNVAETCPLVGGNAVYRARTLLGLLGEIKHYDDLVICNGQGVYKNGISKLQEQINGIQQQLNTSHKLGTDLLVYPNPAQQYVAIEYKLLSSETAQFNLFDILGNKVISTTLDDENSKTTLDIHHLAQGVYSYQLISSDAKVFSGKLVKD